MRGRELSPFCRLRTGVRGRGATRRAAPRKADGVWPRSEGGLPARPRVGAASATASPGGRCCPEKPLTTRRAPRVRACAGGAAAAGRGACSPLFPRRRASDAPARCWRRALTLRAGAVEGGPWRCGSRCGSLPHVCPPLPAATLGGGVSSAWCACRALAGGLIP